MKSGIGFLDEFEETKLSSDQEEKLDIIVDLAIVSAESLNQEAQASQTEETSP